MSIHIPAPLSRAYGYALAKSPKAIEPLDAISRAIRIVGGIEGAPDSVLRESVQVSWLATRIPPRIEQWLNEGTNRAKVDDVALALIDGRLSNKTDDKTLDAILRTAESRLDLPPFVIPDAYPTLHRRHAHSLRTACDLAQAYRLAWGSPQFAENVRIKSEDYEARVSCAYADYDSRHEHHETFAAFVALLEGRYSPSHHVSWFEMLDSCRAIFRIAESLASRDLSDKPPSYVPPDIADSVSDILYDDMTCDLLSERDPVAVAVHNYARELLRREFPEMMRRRVLRVPRP